jgi:hypothetical protein
MIDKVALISTGFLCRDRARATYFAALAYEADPDKVRTRAREWASRNPEKRRRNRADHREARIAQHRLYNDEHRAEIKAYFEDHPGQHRRWLEDNKEQQRTYSAEYRATHAAYFRDAEDRRRSAPRYPRMDPWPTDCQICHEPIDQSLKYPDPRFGSRGHEPPIAWLLRNPDYTGPLVLRPEHYACNKRKHDKPDWIRCSPT